MRSNRIRRTNSSLLTGQFLAGFFVFRGFLKSRCLFVQFVYMGVVPVFKELVVRGKMKIYLRDSYAAMTEQDPQSF